VVSAAVGAGDSPAASGACVASGCGEASAVGVASGRGGGCCGVSVGWGLGVAPVLLVSGAAGVASSA
jgi:hypothetical protein